jgi:hypothetical protein
MRRLRKVRISILLSCLLVLCAAVGERLRAEETSYLESVLREAHETALHQDRYWHTLLHYKKGLIGTRSLIDDPRFFLAKDGKYNPEAELDATIRAIFRNETGGGKPAACRLVARYDWIREKLRLMCPVFPLRNAGISMNRSNLSIACSTR